MSLSASQARVLSAYRQLFRARSKLFRGDVVALRESRTAIRQQFAQNAGAEASGPHFEGLLQMADEAADMMLRGIVQGRLNDRTGHYEVKFEREHVAEDMSYVEPITQETVQKLQKPMVQKTASGSGGGNTCGTSHIGQRCAVSVPKLP